MRRIALIAIPVVALGVLAGCDLPGGTPPAFGPDRVPNDTVASSPIVQIPVTINGSVDDNGDNTDYFRLAPPANTTTVTVSCPATATGLDSFIVALFVEGEIEGTYCNNGARSISRATSPTTNLVLQVDQGQSSEFHPYTIRITYGGGNPV